MVFKILAILMIAQLVYPTFTILLSRLFGRERLRSVYDPERRFDYACVITAYKNAAIAEPLLRSLLQQRYERFHVYLVADECPVLGFALEDPRVTILQPDPPLRLKAKSIIYALERFVRQHDYVVVFDADNLAHPDFLATVNRYANAGHRCIQGQRTAKNLDTTYAALDSMGEHYKNHIERYVPYLLGGSAVISGSGMATEAALYRAYLDSPEIQAGKEQWKKMLQEDKILQNFLLSRGEHIAYARQAIVYDEKVEKAAEVETQRSRWLYSYFQNMPNAFRILLGGLLRLDLNRVYFGFVTLALPMFIQVGVGGLLFLLGLWLQPYWALALFFALGVFALGIVLALYFDGAPRPVWVALAQTPRFVLRQVLGLLKMRNPNKNFKHTEHRRAVDVDEVMKGKG
jgi:cellulose synthase/poly-beta-1,6-N-acetylglucosamine synthase-like glycosyltransferase